MKMTNCIICNHETRDIFDKQLKVIFHHCPNCEFIYQDPSTHVDIVGEKTQYDLHENSMENKGYVSYLQSFLDQHIVPLGQSGHALDFGSGPGPVLHELMKNHFSEVDHYDPIYHNDVSIFDKTYDLITSTEVAEHFTDPIKEFTRLKTLLNKDGYLVIMTNFRHMDIPAFLQWWYRRDTTHISFYHIQSFKKICSIVGLSIVSHNNKNVIILKRAN